MDKKKIRLSIAFFILGALLVAVNPSDASTYYGADEAFTTSTFKTKIKREIDRAMNDAFKQIKPYDKEAKVNQTPEDMKKAGQDVSQNIMQQWQSFMSAKAKLDSIQSLFSGFGF